MGSSLPISLFSVEPKTRAKPFTFLLSIVAHVLIAGLIAYGFIFAPRIDMRSAADRYVFRQVDITLPDDVRPQHAANTAMYPGQNSAAHSESPHSLLARAHLQSSTKLQALHLADRTIVQPDIQVNRHSLTKAKSAFAAILWSAQRPKLQLIATSAAAGETRHQQHQAGVLTRPTPETHISDVPISSTQFESKTAHADSQPILAGCRLRAPPSPI